MVDDNDARSARRRRRGARGSHGSPSAGAAAHRRGHRGRLRGSARGRSRRRSDRRLRVLSHGRAGTRLARGASAAAERDTSRIYCAAASPMNTARPMMDRRLKERLVGATILVAVIVLVVPELLSGPKHSALPPLAAGLPTTATRSVSVDLATNRATVEPAPGAASPSPRPAGPQCAPGEAAAG